MVRKVFGYGIAGLLTVALVAGMIYILARPQDVAASQGPVGGQGQGRTEALGAGTGDRGGLGDGGEPLGQGRNADRAADCDERAPLAQSQGGQAGAQGFQSGAGGGRQSDALGQGTQGGSQGFQGGAGQGAQGGAAQGQGLEDGTGRGQGNGLAPESGAAREDVAWETVTGRVLVAEGDMVLETAEGEFEVGLGQAWYRDEAGLVLEVGDEVTVTGFYEDGEFKAGTVENLTRDQTVVLRDESGRPMWSGRGALKNQ